MINFDLTNKKEIEKQFCGVIATSSREFSISEERIMNVVYQFIIVVIFKL